MIFGNISAYLKKTEEKKNPKNKRQLQQLADDTYLQIDDIVIKKAIFHLDKLATANRSRAEVEWIRWHTKKNGNGNNNNKNINSKSNSNNNNNEIVLKWLQINSASIP